MKFSELIQNRQSTRSYDASRVVEKAKLEACIEAARLTPSACNSQPWHFTLCTGDAAKRVEPYTHGLGMNKWTTEVPVFVIVSESSYNITSGIGAKVKNHDFRSNDIGAAVVQFTLEAAEQGLGTCILGWFSEEPLRKQFGIKNRIHLLIAVGYPQVRDPIRIKKRKTQAEIADWLD